MPQRHIFIAITLLFTSSCATSGNEQCRYQDFTAIGTVSAVDNKQLTFTLLPQRSESYPIENQHARFTAQIDPERYPRMVAELGRYHRLRLRTLTHGNCTPYYVLAASAARLDDVTATASISPSQNTNSQSAVFNRALLCSQDYQTTRNVQTYSQCLAQFAQMRSRSSQKQLGKWLNQINLLSLERCNSTEQKLVTRHLMRVPDIPHATLCAHYQEGPLYKTAVVVFGWNASSNNWKIIAVQEL